MVYCRRVASGDEFPFLASAETGTLYRFERLVFAMNSRIWDGGRALGLQVPIKLLQLLNGLHPRVTT